MNDDRQNGELRLTDAQVEALFWLPSRERFAAVELAVIEQLIAIGVIVERQDGEYELTDCGRSVYLKAVMAREG